MNRTARTARQGFSLVEVLLAVVIVAGALVPVLSLHLQTARGASFNEHHLQARLHARRVAETLAALDYDALRLVAAGDDGGSLPVMLPPTAVELARLSGASAAAALPRHLAVVTAATDRFHDEATFEEIDPTGLACIRVRVSWRMPGDGPATPLHDVTCRVFVSRRDLSLTRRPAPVPTGSLS